MTSLSRRHFSWTLLLLSSALFVVYVDAFGRKNKPNEDFAQDDGDDDTPRVHYLLEMIGKEIYAVVKKPKYKFYIYMTIGSLPSEKNTIVLLSTICNVLYGSSILAGFLFLQRGPMLVFALCTIWLGPALVLILLGTVALTLAVFALYPMVSVTAMILWFFLTSKLAQALGKRYGLDSDGDGDVDWLDLLHYASQTNVGQAIGLQRLHDILNQANQDPFQEIHRRLDKILQDTQHESISPMNGGIVAADKKEP